MIAPLLSILLATTPPAAAATAPAKPPVAVPASGFSTRAASLIPLLNGETAPEAAFSPAMLASVPASQIRAIFSGLTARYGRAQKLASVEPAGETSGLVVIGYERGSISLRIVFDPQPGGKIAGLQIVAEQVANDSLSAVLAELKALPGQASASIAALDEAGPRALGGSDPDRAMAIGSAFKLFILAELVREVKAGERKWNDVVPLTHRSLPSGILQDWPAGAPMTVYALAALMISRSDNSATDTLLHLAGRERVERMLETVGMKAPTRNRPFLATREAFAIKADPSLTAKWSASGEAARRTMLPPLAASPIDVAALAGPPKAIGTVEWFATPGDLVRVMDWLRRNADQTGLDILAINPGLGAETAGDFGYLGYKGGSEAGVIEMTFLMRRKDGAWRAVAAGWNNPEAAVDEAKFLGLMRRLVALQR